MFKIEGKKGLKKASKLVLDVCCGSKMFWFDKNDPRAIFGDIREETHTLCDGRALEIKPDIKFDFRNLPFSDNIFKLVVFDPPHLRSCGTTSWIGKKYGILSKDWKEDLTLGFSQCFRVLEPNGVLIFKWNEDQIKVSEILKLTDQKPLFGHRSGKASKTHWISFIKEAL